MLFTHSTDHKNETNSSIKLEVLDFFNDQIIENKNVYSFLFLYYMFSKSTHFSLNEAIKKYQRILVNIIEDKCRLRILSDTRDNEPLGLIIYQVLSSNTVYFHDLFILPKIANTHDDIADDFLWYTLDFIFFY